MHHSEWSPKPFFRHLSPTALIELCAWASDLRPEGPGKPWEQLYRAWARLEPDVRMKLESSLLPVNDLSVPEARPRLTELAAAVWPRGQLAEDSRSWSSQDLALRLFLASPGSFQQLHQGWVVDSLQHMKEYAGRYPLRPKPSARAKAELKDALRAYLQRTAFGPRCHIEDFANDEKFALFVFLEDELKPTDKFTESEDLESVWEREVVRLAAVFDYETSVLSVKAAHREEREQLRDLFAEHVMQDPLYFIDAYSAPRYAFGRIADPRFQFTPIAGSEVVAVTVQKLVVHPSDGDVRRVTLEFKGTPTLEQVRTGLQAHGLRVPGDTIDGVHLRFVFEGTGRSRTRTVSLFNPNSTNLSDTPRDRHLHRFEREPLVADRQRESPAAVLECRREVNAVWMPEDDLPRVTAPPGPRLEPASERLCVSARQVEQPTVSTVCATPVGGKRRTPTQVAEGGSKGHACNPEVCRSGKLPQRR